MQKQIILFYNDYAPITNTSSHTGRIPIFAFQIMNFFFGGGN